MRQPEQGGSGGKGETHEKEATRKGEASTWVRRVLIIFGGGEFELTK